MPAVSLVPPAFPVTMSVPPPGYSAIPPPPFLRASFNPSQPPPGELVKMKMSMPSLHASVYIVFCIVFHQILVTV